MFSKRAKMVAASAIAACGLAVTLAVNAVAAPATSSTVATTASAGVATTASANVPTTARAAVATNVAAPRPAGKPRVDWRARLLRHSVFAQIEVRTKHGFVTFTFQRALVISVSANSITVKGLDGRIATYATNAETKVHRLGKPASLTSIQPGDRVLIAASGTPPVVRSIADPGPPCHPSMATPSANPTS
ncbi:MAG: hypothetical protein ACYCO3_03450 [Mycobacteriales bacterium]